MLPEMLDDMAKLVVDPIFEPKNVDKDRPNDFECLYREEQACQNNLPINRRRPFALDLCYPIPEMKP